MEIDQRKQYSNTILLYLLDDKLCRARYHRYSHVLYSIRLATPCFKGDGKHYVQCAVVFANIQNPLYHFNCIHVSGLVSASDIVESLISSVFVMCGFT